MYRETLTRIGDPRKYLLSGSTKPFVVSKYPVFYTYHGEHRYKMQKYTWNDDKHIQPNNYEHDVRLYTQDILKSNTYEGIAKSPWTSAIKSAKTD